MRKKLAKADGTLMISPDASPLERFRWDLCQKFLPFKMDHDLSQVQMADLLGVDKAKVSKIIYGAHPLKRFLQRDLETKIGRALIAGGIAEGPGVTVDEKDGSLTIAVAPAKVAR